MSVQYRYLDQFRPTDASFGEVVGIQLVHSLGYGVSKVVNFTKRKSIHVPPSANAYWNYMNLTVSVTKLLKNERYSPDMRKSLRRDFIRAIGNIHLYALERAYGTVDNGEGRYTAPEQGVILLDWKQSDGQYFDLVFCDNSLEGISSFWDGFLIRPTNL